MIMNIISRVIYPIIMIGVLWSSVLFNLNLQETFIYSIADQVIKNRLLILLFLLVSGGIGVLYKNRKKYYSLYINVNITLCYIVYLSRVITKHLAPDCYLKITLTIIFSVLFLLAYLFKDELKEDVVETTQNILNPVSKYKDLYESRIHLAKKLINIIKSNESDGGYAICISAEWGEGKTSFVNAVLDELDIEYRDKTSTLSINEIRINAMELDNLPALVNYLFNRIKDILKENGVYVGINSEYQDLISSLTGTIMNETAGNYIKNKLSSNSDYRENLCSLNQLIGTHFVNKKIVIVVDDLERCTKEKVLDFLFFIKEIAMLNRCVILFLSDYNKLLKCTELEDEFLEKFFNYKMNLQPVDIKEIIERSINDKSFFELLNDSKNIYFSKIEEAKNGTYLYIDPKERSDYKKECIEEKEYEYELFIEYIQNPRRLIKIYKKYKELINIVEALKKKDNEENKYCEFINKINYKKQIFLISMLYGFSVERYEYIECKGIESYIYNIDIIYNENEIKQFSDDCIIDVLACEEWTMKLNDYIVNEKIRFISNLLSSPDDLTKISNGFTSLQEQYVSLIKNNMKPDGVSLSRVLRETINAKFSSEEEKRNHISTTMMLYKNDLSFDEAISQISDKEIWHYIKQEYCIFEIFYEVFKGVQCNNKDKCLNEFISFTQHYMRYRLNDITRYIFILDKENNDWEYTNEVVYSKNDCSSMIYAYYDKIIETFKLNLDKKSSPIDCLMTLYDKANSYCKNNNISILSDIREIANRAKETIESLEYLIKIEECINLKVDNQFRNKFIGDNYSEKLDDVIDLINSNDDNGVYRLRTPINSLLNEIINSDNNITENDLGKINTIIDLHFSIFGEPNIFWRKIYIELKQKISNQ